MARQFRDFSSSAEESKKRIVPDRVLLRRVYKYAKPYRRNLVFAIFAIVVNSVTSVLIPYMCKVAVDQIIQPRNLSVLTWWVPTFSSLIIINYLAQYVQVFQMRLTGERVISGMRTEMVSKLQTISLRYFSEGEIGRIISRPTNDANVARLFLRQGFISIILDATSILGIVIIIFFLSAKLALLTLIIIPVTAYIANYLGKFSRGVNRKSLTYTSGMMSKMQESLSGIRVIKSFVQEDKDLRGFKESQNKVVSARLRAVLVSASYQPVVYAMRVIGTALVLWFGAALVGTGEITIGTFIAFTEYQLLLFNPLLQLATAYDQYQSAMAAIERMLDVIDTSQEVEDPPEDRAVKIDKIREVKFEKVTFGYDSRTLVVKSIDLSVRSNEKLAIVGPTGAGKSTVINLLSRFYDPLEGKISINGEDIRNIKMADLRGRISIVLQDSFLFPMCVIDNIRLGKPDATDEEVVEAAKTIGAHEFIMSLPEGYNFQITEGSSNISIGQRQLISFARTILADPDLLILDEATSSVDPYTELIIQNALKKLLEKRMTIIIAHRLSTIRLCDEIIVIDHGEVVERGTHAELMKKQGLYSSFYRKQFKEEADSTVNPTTSS